MGSGSSKASSAGPSRVPANKQPLQREQKESTQPNRQAASAPNGQPNRQPVSVSDQKENTNTTSNKQQISLPKNSTEVENGRPSIIKEKSMQFNEARKRISSAVSRKANVQKRFSRGFSMAKIQATKDKCTDNPVLLGDISKPIPPTAKIVRIFTSSTFTDTKYERNSWMVNSYPKIQSFCRDHGYDFQVVDMRWGVRDEATDDHSVLDLCLRELEQCQKLSTGPNFVCLLSHRYGYRNLLKQIEAKEFEQLLPAITSAEDKDLLNKWYKRDDNAVPPVYVLQRISTLLPDFVSKTNKEDRDKAKADWWTDSDKMQDLLASAAEKCLGPEKSRNYLVSVTEREIQRGLLEVENQDTTCMWFKRNLLGIEGDRQSNSLSRYIDFSGEEEKWKKSRQLLSELKDEKMSKALPENNIVTYNVKWISGGIDPEVKEHSQYLNKISEDLVTNMQQMIDTAIKAREKQEMVEPILEECKQQIMFCQHKSNGFRGRDDILQKIKIYVTGRSQKPLVVHGSSGCGKTSIIAMATKLTKTSWLKQAAVVCRFLGTTPDSSTIGPLLKSLILQIKKIYGQETGLSGEGIEDLKEEFVASLGLPFGNAPLIIFLDSLDQLDPANGARGVSWLPTEFSENVKIVVSTLVDRQYEAFPKLKAALPDDDSFIDVPVLSVEDAESIIKSWLESQHRTLTSKQNDIVVKAFNEYPLALYLKLSLNEACQWSSFSPPDQTVLQNTVRKSIDTLFHQLEVRYGKLFVSRTLGYLTVALNGLSESELEDILSCDDDVLNDVYQYWTPPTRRSPPLLLVRLKTDLDQYLVDRGADGMRVIYWYHRQFIEAAMDIYCTEKNQKILHSALADFFAGIWSNGNKKPFVNNKNKKGSEDRLVTAQPLMFKDKYNFRKLGHQPYHRIKAGQLDLVKSECLCNFKFLQTKLIAMTYRRVFMDLNLARNTFESDKELAWIADAFRLSEYALSHDPYQLAPHIIDRLSKEKVVSKFVEQCKQSDFPYLASSDEVLLKPGGELIYTMTGHTSSVNSLDVMADGSMAVTCGQYGDDVIRTWSLKKGKLVKEYENLPRDPEKVYFVDEDKKILIHYRSSVVVISISDNKQFTQEISHMCQLCVCGPNRSIFGTFLIRGCNFYSVIDGTVKNKLTCDGNKNLFDIRSIISATTNYVALTHATEDEFYVINLVTKDLSISKRETSGKFSVDAIVITYSEKIVICASFLESTIRLHDINTLNIIKTIQTRDDPYEEISNFHVTKDGNCLYFPCYRYVIMIDLKNETETKKFRSHPDSITDVQIFSNDKAVSITQDSIVRIWDMAESAKTSETDCSLMDHRIIEFRPLPNCRHVVILGNPKATVTDDYYMYVYDLVDKCIVQSTELDEGSHIVEAIDDNTVLVLPMSLKPKTIDLKTMTIKTVFQGKVCERCKSYKMAKGGKEFMCLSRGRKNIKVYNTATGKVIKILKSPKEGDYRIDSFFTNRDGSVIVAKADETFIIFDGNDGKTTTVTASNLKMEIIGNVCSVSPNGNYVVLSACKVETTEVWDSEPMAFLWNVKKAKMAYQLIDSEYMMNYKKSDAPVTVALDEVRFLDDEKIVSSHDDFIIRVWSTETGGLLHRLTGHTKQAMLSVPDGGPYFLSYGFMGEEVIKLWDRINFQCISSFTLDTTVGKLRFCGDNETFITSTKNPVNLIYWSLHGREPAKPLHKYPKLQRKNYNIQLEIETEEDSVEDGDDPDTDLEELEESDDEFSDPEY